jgi:hypothetical protein
MQSILLDTVNFEIPPILSPWICVLIALSKFGCQEFRPISSLYGRGDVPQIVAHNGVRLCDVSVLDISDSNDLPNMFCILNHIKAVEDFEPS